MDIAITKFILIFTSIVYEALPFIVLGVVIAGLLEEFVPQQAIARIIPKFRPFGIAIGAVLGLIFPMCECGIIVVMRRLLRKGLPLSVCVSYMLAGPVINVVVIMSTFVAFDARPVADKTGEEVVEKVEAKKPDAKAAEKKDEGTPSTTAAQQIYGSPYNVVIMRCGLAFLVAFITGLVVEHESKKYGLNLLHPTVVAGLQNADDDEEQKARTWKDRLNNITETALHDFIDILAFLILGAVLAGVGRLVLEQQAWDKHFEDNGPLAILTTMAMAVLFCLCSEADAFVAANFGTFFPPASKMAFLVLGPMLDLKLLLMYTRVFRGRLIFTIVRMVVAQVLIYSLLVYYLIDPMF